MMKSGILAVSMQIVWGSNSVFSQLFDISKTTVGR